MSAAGEVTDATATSQSSACHGHTAACEATNGCYSRCKATATASVRLSLQPIPGPWPASPPPPSCRCPTSTMPGSWPDPLPPCLGPGLPPLPLQHLAKSWSCHDHLPSYHLPSYHHAWSLACPPSLPPCPPTTSWSRSRLPDL